MSEVYKGKFFGAKRIKDYFDVKEVDNLEDSSKYDFLLKDRCTYSNNGNVSFAAFVMTELGSEPIFYGWRIEKLRFPGNWFGQGGLFVLIDRYGVSFESEARCGSQWYRNSQEEFISDCLVEAVKFAKNNHSVKYINFLKGFDGPSSNMSLNGFHNFINKVDKYIEDFKEIKEALINDNASDEMIQRLNESFHAQIKKCFSFDIELPK
jgi:hypothetical protein